jgi:hypothetical protein
MRCATTQCMSADARKPRGGCGELSLGGGHARVWPWRPRGGGLACVRPSEMQHSAMYAALVLCIRSAAAVEAGAAALMASITSWQNMACRTLLLDAATAAHPLATITSFTSWVLPAPMHCCGGQLLWRAASSTGQLLWMVASSTGQLLWGAAAGTPHSCANGSMLSATPGNSWRCCGCCPWADFSRLLSLLRIDIQM